MTIGCPELTESTYCERHEGGGRRPPPQQVHAYDSRWRKLRQWWIAKQPLCRHCERDGRVTPADEVDHIVPWRGDERLLLAHWNLQSLCRPCHHRKTRSDETWVPLRFPRPPLGSSPPDLVVFAGPPAAGKTTAARASGRPVIDLDAIYLELGVRSPRMVSIEIVQLALAKRNEMLMAPGPLALAAMLPTRHERAYFETIWDAPPTLLLPPRPVLLERINTRPPAAREAALEALARWDREWEPPGDESPVECYG